MKTFHELLQQNALVFLDGATGSQLQKRGMPAGVCPELWILGHRDVFLALQREYVAAGSQIIYAPTFTGNRIKLAEYQIQDRLEEINTALVALSKEAAGENALVAGDITMTGRQLSPTGDLDFEELVDIYKEQIRVLAAAGVDALVVETMMSLQETRAAVIAAREVCELPVMATLSFEKDGRTLFGTDAATAAVVLEKLGAAAVGANCSTGPTEMAKVIAAMREVCEIPLIAKPNAGLPSLDKDGKTVYDMEPEEFAEGIKALTRAGAMLIGGCCGTSPAYISAMKQAGLEYAPAEPPQKGVRYLASERRLLAFSTEDKFRIIGERINPTGKKKLQESLRAGSMDLVRDYAEEQEACGAAVLDVNMGMGGIDEKEMMAKAIETVTEVSGLPLCIDSSHVDVMEAALRRYPGRALINSISLESAKCEPLLRLAKKYGAMFILLPLSDKGLPENTQEKTEIIETIRKKAAESGLTDDDLIVDGLVATVGANPTAALETIETIRYCKKNGLATVCGLSNISFGLPERGFINSVFLTMAIQAGLTMAIANPSQELLVSCASAADLLLHKEGADIAYIDLMSAYQAEKQKTGAAWAENAGIHMGGTAGTAGAEQTTLEKIKRDVLQGSREKIVEDTGKAVEEGEKPQDILDTVLLPAINEVGELFDSGKYFLPQLIASAEAMKNSIEYLEPLLKTGSGGKDMPVVVIATVEGDIHDIGKNLVALMLKNYGFKVIDLGKDVSKEEIVEAAEKYQAKVIALSALMTTTMQQMKHVIEYAREKKLDAKIIIGGAVITQEYADEIGADGYSRDAADAVKLVKELV